MKAVLFIVLVAAGELALVFGVFSCGGAPFTLIPADPHPEASPFDSPLWSPEADPLEAEASFRLPRPEAGLDAPHEAEASTIEASEASPIEAEAGQPQEACVPIPPSAFSCGTDRVALLAPTDFCVDEALPMTAPGHAVPTPTPCRCDYNCRCILAVDPNPCAVYGQTVLRCLDNGAPGMKPGSTVVCQ